MLLVGNNDWFPYPYQDRSLGEIENAIADWENDQLAIWHQKPEYQGHYWLEVEKYWSHKISKDPLLTLLFWEYDRDYMLLLHDLRHPKKKAKPSPYPKVWSNHIQSSEDLCGLR